MTARGDYNLFQKENEIPLTKKGNVWVLDRNKELLKEGDKYSFFISLCSTLLTCIIILNFSLQKLMIAIFIGSPSGIAIGYLVG